MRGVPLSACARAAYVALVRRFVISYGFSMRGAYQLLRQVGRLQIGNMIDPFYSVLASIDTTYVEG